MACGACFGAVKAQADWIIHIDIDEFVWSPKYPHLPDYFLHEVPEITHILYVGASRFGWEGQRRRYTWALEPVGPPFPPPFPYTHSHAWLGPAPHPPKLRELQPPKQH